MDTCLLQEGSIGAAQQQVRMLESPSVHIQVATSMTKARIRAAVTQTSATLTTQPAAQRLIPRLQTLSSLELLLPCLQSSSC